MDFAVFPVIVRYPWRAVNALAAIAALNYVFSPQSVPALITAGPQSDPSPHYPCAGIALPPAGLVSPSVWSSGFVS